MPTYSIMRNMRTVMALGLIAVGAIANADPISVYSTGFGLPTGASDSNWTIDGTFAKVSDAHSAWTGGNAILAAGNAKWINVAGSSSTEEPASIDAFSTSFDLSGYDPATASLTVWWSSDNGSKLYLNGNLVDDIPGIDNGVQSYQTNKSVTITSGFLAGLNTLTFDVTNGDDGIPQQGPIGLIADVSGTVNAVPEPASMIALGLGGMALLRRRRKA
ncbi:PEP-CTERM sorting domain-containing protein [bacterium]|nr:MAG: PEP-CTERM sorting domain-containing protein [bacterium]